jgi:molybdopterin molybdotransferase
VQQALSKEGLDLSFWKVALRPGKPMMKGALGTTRFLGLPGNPVSAYVCALLFLRPLLRRLAGRTDLALDTVPAVLGRDLKANDERSDYLRATLEARPDGTLVATPAPIQDSSMLAPLAAADCLVVREPFAPAAFAGEPCAVVKLVL